jgi:5-methylcytosine-specific restriction endonuclease McrA
MTRNISNGDESSELPFNPESLLLKSPCLLGVESIALPTTLSIALDRDTGRPILLYQGKRLFKSRQFKTCLICGVETGRNALCQPCYQRARDIRYGIRCANCGKKFTRSRYEVEKALAKNCVDLYCSPSCSAQHHSIKNHRQCKLCGRATETKTSRYCAECRPIHPTHVKRLSKIACGYCGITFRPISHRTVYCSKQCQNYAHSVRMRGKGNSHYKSGASYADWFRKMRPIVLERDGHECAVCGAVNDRKTTRRPLKNGGYQVRSTLAIHHIDHNPANNRVENLISLCFQCHKSHHRITDAGRLTPFPQLPHLAQSRSQCMTSKLKAIATSLQTVYLSTTAE